jgi:hypothetical protein
MLSKHIFRVQSLNKIILPSQFSPLNNTQKRNASAFKFQPDIAPASLGETTKMNLFQSVTNALDISLSSDKSAGLLHFLNGSFIN